MSIFKEETPLTMTKGPVRDVYSKFIIFRRKHQGGPKSKIEEQHLRERYKPLKQKFANKKKEKVDDDDIEKKGLKYSTLSDDSSARSEPEEIKETKADSIDSNEKGAVDFGR